MVDHSQWLFGALSLCAIMLCSVCMWMIEAFGVSCLGVNNRSVWSGVGDFSALSWESVDGCHVRVDDK